MAAVNIAQPVKHGRHSLLRLPAATSYVYRPVARTGERVQPIATHRHPSSQNHFGTQRFLPGDGLRYIHMTISPASSELSTRWIHVPRVLP